MLRRWESIVGNLSWAFWAFWALPLLQSDWRSANARNVSFFYPLRWLIYVLNSAVNTKLPAILSHRCSTTVSLETYPFIMVSSKIELILEAGNYIIEIVKKCIVFIFNLPKSWYSTSLFPGFLCVRFLIIIWQTQHLFLIIFFYTQDKFKLPPCMRVVKDLSH